MKDLRCKYRTGRSRKIVEITSSKDKIKYSYELSVVTEHGEYSEKDWMRLVEKQAKDLIELDILEQLKRYCIDKCAWINTDKEAYKYALELYATRIWEKESWVGYEEFNSIIKTQSDCEQMKLI